MLNLASRDRFQMGANGLNCPTADKVLLGFEDVPELFNEGVKRATRGANLLAVKRYALAVNLTIAPLRFRPT